jgi:hypothetical protein
MWNKDKETMMERRKTCKHWASEDPNESAPLLGGGECHKAPKGSAGVKG